MLYLGNQRASGALSKRKVLVFRVVGGYKGVSRHAPTRPVCMAGKMVVTLLMGDEAFAVRCLQSVEFKRTEEGAQRVRRWG